MMKFIRKYGLTVIFAIVITATFCGGIAVGRQHSKDVPVFVNVYVPVESVEEIEEVIEPAPKTVTLTATAYCACEKCCGVWATNRPLDKNGNPIVYTANGTVAEANKTIAVDPAVFEYGTVLEIDGIEYVAEDCGGAIKGNEIDIYFDSHQEALEFGRQEVVAVVKSEGAK